MSAASSLTGLGVAHLVVGAVGEIDIGVDAAPGIGQHGDLDHVGQIAELVDHDLGVDPEPSPDGGVRHHVRGEGGVWSPVNPQR